MPGIRRAPSAAQMAEFGSRVRAQRERRGWNKSELARRVGVEYHTIIRWERGVRWPTPVALRVLAEELGTSVDALVEGEAER